LPTGTAKLYHARVVRNASILVVLWSLGGCHHASSPSATATPEVIFSSRAGEIHSQVEVARNDHDRMIGLMFRSGLIKDHGMVFIFDHPEHTKFWMKNTYIPLDMIFVSEGRKVIYVEENAEPLTLTQRGPEEESRYVIEMAGGWARAHGIERGVDVRFAGIPGVE
jgi:uncharacterized membrane protein (UPF0127 family)